MKTFRVFDLAFVSGSISEVVQRIAQWIDTDKHAYICVTGAHGVVEASGKPLVKTAHKEATLIVPDGMPLVWIGRLLGAKNTQRIYGPDLFLALCRRAQEEKWSIFLYGSSPHVLKKLTSELIRRFPLLRVAGRLAPPFRLLSKAEDEKFIDSINATKAQIVFVGLSTPKQEIWMYEHRSRLNVNVLIGVGAAFDFVARTKKQAPRFIQQSGFEWLFRFLQEPRRLWRRALVVNARFLILTAKETLSLVAHVRRRNVLRTILVSLLLTGLLLGLAELASRMMTDFGFISYYHPIKIQTLIEPSAQTEDWRLTHIYRDEQFMPDSLLFWKPKPGAWRYNKDGFVGSVNRSVLHEAKERGGCSVLAIGDSNTQGIAEFSWPESLNELFVTNGLSTRVANAGVAGYSSFQGEYLYNQLAASLQPTVVVVSFGWNDMTPDMGMPDRNFSRFSLPANSLLSRSKLYLIIQNIFSPKVENDGEYHPRVSVSEYKENLNAIITTAQQHKSTVLLLTRPYNPEHMVWNSVSPLLKGGWRKYVYDYNGVVRDVAHKRSVQLIDMEAKFSTDAAYFLDDSHFTLEASRIAAMFIYEQMRRNDLVCK